MRFVSVLAHVVLGGALQNEPAATQALAYILKSSPDIARAFVGMLRDADIEFEPGRIEAELEHEESQPDLTIHDGEGRARVFVENKFWAGLTDAQPVSYLGHLPEAPPSALVFIVPEQRVSTVWDELRTRCNDAELEWQDAAGNHARIGGKTMLVASWGRVLERLLDAAYSGGHDDLRRDILQLRGLTDQMDAEAFLPLRGDEVTDQEMARRLINYSDLIENITQRFIDTGVADRGNLRTAHGYQYIGRNFLVHDQFTSWLGIDFNEWRFSGITPLWWYIDRGPHNLAEHFTANPETPEGVKYYNNDPYVPIRLTPGVERDRVINDAVAQMEHIANILQEIV